jgi:hypothetical protein
MHYEYEDYRKKPPKPMLGSWPLWIVPNIFVMDYLIKLAMFIFLIPALFGVALTTLGLFLNFCLVDFIMYMSYKSRINNLWGEDE